MPRKPKDHYTLSKGTRRAAAKLTRRLRRSANMGQTQKIGKVATTVVEGHVTVVTYHKTAVVKFDGKQIELNTGGWKTVTTKSRMNQASNEFKLGFAVYAQNGEWYVNYRGRTSIPFEGKTLILKR